MNDIQMWNNAAFDDRGGNNNEDSFFPMKTSWSSSECTKENLSPPAPNHSTKKTNTTTTATKKKNPKGFGFNFSFSSDDDNNIKNVIDDEIEEVEREIKRLTTRLDALRLEKAKRSKRVVAVGRAVPAKFMEPRPPNAIVSRKPEETPKATKVKSSNNNAWRRGMSMGPAEIAATPATAAQNRRKSCFWKLPEIDEDSRAKATVGRVKKKNSEISVIQVQGKKLFEKEKVKSVCESGKKGLVKQGRVVASRYNNGGGGGGGDLRKRSLPEGGSEIRVKKRWEMPKNEAVAATAVMLPKIKTAKCVNESPRDSGAAKRVAELVVGNRPYFSTDENDVCQILNFAEEEEEGQ